MTIKVRDLLNKKIPKRITVDENILAYLKKRQDLAFTQDELRNALGLSQSNLSARLSRMKRKGLVKHEDRYWYYRPQIKLQGKGVRNTNRKGKAKSKGKDKARTKGK